ncbi:hypothetical protein YPPY113_3597, partial [Yersinia pestis PY-113]
MACSTNPQTCHSLSSIFTPGKGYRLHW